MTRTISFSQLRPEFHDFLYAPVGDDSNGMLVSVLSALARLNVDPWQEAAELSRLPRDTAIQRLISLIASLPYGLAAFPDREIAAARLVALLPHRLDLEAPARGELVGARSVTKSQLLFIYVTDGDYSSHAQCTEYYTESSAASASGQRSCVRTHLRKKAKGGFRRMTRNSSDKNRSHIDQERTHLASC